MARRPARDAVAWETIQLNPHLVGSYSRDDYHRRLRKIAPLERDEMARAWGADESALFDALVVARAEMAEQARQRMSVKWQEAAERYVRRRQQYEAKARQEEARAARDPESATLHLLKARVKWAQAEVCAEEERSALAQLAALDNTEAAWTP